MGSAQRTCPQCGKPIARLNPGPLCFACQKDGPEAAARPRRRRVPRTDPDLVARVHRLAAGGASHAEIARETGIPRSTVYSLIKRGSPPEAVE